MTSSGGVGITMLHVSGRAAELQWFDFQPTFYGEVIRVEWEPDTMNAILPSDIAEVLIAHGHARPMSEDDVKAHNAEATKEGDQP